MVARPLKAVLDYGLQAHTLLEAWRAAPSGGPDIQPAWPLPRSPRVSADEAQRALDEFDLHWLSLEFEDGLRAEGGDSERILQRFRHFMPEVVRHAGGSLEGKRVLDIAGGSGFWSLQCALLGARVSYFDGRAKSVEEARTVAWIAGVEGIEFNQLDFWEMDPETLGGPFHVVLNLGILYHLPKPLAAIELAARMARRGGIMVLDTQLLRRRGPMISLAWEGPVALTSAVDVGVVAFPSKAAVDLMLRHVGFASWEELPLRSTDMPFDYLTKRRATWIAHKA